MLFPPPTEVASGCQLWVFRSYRYPVALLRASFVVLMTGYHLLSFFLKWIASNGGPAFPVVPLETVTFLQQASGDRLKIISVYGKARETLA